VKRPNPFRKSRRSPYDESGPNSKTLHRSLEWLQTHHPDNPRPQLTVEIPKAVPKEDVELLKPMAENHAEEEPSTTVQTAIALEPAPEPPAIETKVDAEAEAAQPEPPAEEPVAALPTETTIAEDEEALFQAAAMREDAPRNDLLDARRFPKHYPATPADPERHERLCSICHHEDRDAIEQAFLQWRRPAEIRFEFKLPSKTSIYRHAHAQGLFERRANALRFGLEKIIEESTICPPSADSIIRAVRAHSCLDERGRWTEHPRRLIISREPYPPPPPRQLDNHIDDDKEIISIGPAAEQKEA